MCPSSVVTTVNSIHTAVGHSPLFDIHGSVHRSMTQQKYQQDAAL